MQSREEIRRQVENECNKCKIRDTNPEKHFHKNYFTPRIFQLLVHSKVQVNIMVDIKINIIVRIMSSGLILQAFEVGNYTKARLNRETQIL